MTSITRYDTATLLGLMEHLEPLNTYFLDSFFTQTVLSDNQYIDFEKITNARKLAPLVVPTAQGKPIFDRASKVTRYSPAYVKPKDVLLPTDVIKKMPGELTAPVALSMVARKDRYVTEMLRQHREAIVRRMEWMASEAIRTGSITLVDDSYPEAVINFERDPAHTVVLTGVDGWNQPTSDILGDINEWARIMTIAKHGGAPTRITFGANAWDAFFKDANVKELLDTQIRGTQGNFNIGLSSQQDVVYKGSINGMELYLYQGYYEDKAGNVVPLMGADEVILSSPNVMGIRAFGAILDMDSLVPTEMWPKAWSQPDPSAEFVMTQSAPLMIPVNPNATFVATVIT